MNQPIYTPLKPSRTRSVDVRGLSYQLREWGDPGDPLLLFLHGHRDASITFQFMIDAMAGRWHVVAPDWRGHGGSAWAPQGYWYQDYLADLDTIVGLVSPQAQLDIVAHSLGGNLATVYAGIRPARVRTVVSIDGFALRDTPAELAPEKLRKWLDSWRATPRERTYASVADMAERLMAANARLTADKAMFLATHLARPVEGGFAFGFDPTHRRPFPTLHRIDEWAASWREAEARVLWIAAGNRFERMSWEGEGGFQWRLSQLRHGSSVQIPDTGHNIHHDAPEVLARVVEDFLTAR